MFDKNKINMAQSLEGNYITVESMNEKGIDYTALRVIQNDLPEFLLKVRSRVINGKSEFIYTMGDGVAIKYSVHNMTKKEFIKLWMNLLTPFIEGSDWFLDYHYICIDPQYVFVDKDFKVSYIYIPDEDFRNTDEAIMSFLKDWVFTVQVKDGNDFLVKLYQSFNKENQVLSKLYEMAEEELKISGNYTRQHYKPSFISDDIVKPEFLSANVREEISLGQNIGKMSKPLPESKIDTGNSGFLGMLNNKEKENTKSDSSKKEKNINDNYDDIDALFGDTGKKKAKKEKEKKGGLFGFGLKKEKQEKQKASNVSSFSVPQQIRPYDTPVRNPVIYSEPQSVPFYNDNINQKSDITEIEGIEDKGIKECLILEDRSVRGVPERIMFDFNESRIFIGRSSNDVHQPDIAFGAEHKKMGRRHACISRENGDYYLIDLGSTNSTMINGTRLIPNKPYKLNNNDIVGFIATNPIKYRVSL
jgi:hypothetical protein